MRFELLTKTHELTPELWKRISHSLSQRIATWDHVTLEVAIGLGEVRFFLEANKDFSAYTSELLPFIVVPVEAAAAEEKAAFCYIDFSEKEHFLRLREREALRKGRTLERVRWHVYRPPMGEYHVVELFFVDGAGKRFRCRRRFLHPRWKFLSIDFGQMVQYKMKSVPDYVNIQKCVPLLSDTARGAIARVLGFPYFHEPKYLQLDRMGYDRHSVVLGQTGTGKSKYLTRFMQEFERQGFDADTTIVVLDPHAVLYTDFSDSPTRVNVDFVHTACQLFAHIGEPNISSELTILLFKSLLGEQFNPKMERVLKYALYSLFASNTMGLATLQALLTDVAQRKAILDHPEINDTIRLFFDTEFTELQTKYYEVSILPVLGLLDELTFLPIGNFQESTPLADLINNHALVFLSLRRMTLGQKATKLIAGLLIQQIFLLAQSGTLKKKIAFIIDEVSIVQNEALAAILSEARKFGLSLTLSQQYLQQVEKPIVQSILTNAAHYVIFKISEEDANLLANNLAFDFPEECVAENQEKAMYEKHLKVKMMTQLHPRECLLRVFSEGVFYPVMKARTMDV